MAPRKTQGGTKEPEPETNFDVIQKVVAEKLRDCGKFPKGVVVTEVVPESLEIKLDQALSSLGMGIFVMEPTPLESEFMGGEGPVFFPKVGIDVRIVTGATLGDTVAAAKAARRVMLTLKGFGKEWAEQGLDLASTPIDKSIYDDGKYTIDVHFTFPAHLFYIGEAAENEGETTPPSTEEEQE